MNVSHLRGYGIAFSDLEATWPPAMKAEMKRRGMAAVMARLSLWERVRFFVAFLAAQRRAARMDVSDLRARGLDNDAFYAQQREYLSMYAALTQVVGPARALEIAMAVMDASAREPMLHCLPDPDEVRALGDPWEVFRLYLDPVAEATAKAGCQEIERVVTPQAAGFDVKWCVWLELARRMGVPDAALPNCHSDEIAFPAYFQALGITYRRTGTLAGGARCCDFRFERTVPSGPTESASNASGDQADGAGNRYP